MNAANGASRRKAPLETPSRLSADQRRDIAAGLNLLLADSFALYIKTKNFHWHVSGPHFRDYHLMLHQQADQIFATTDLIAERVRKVGETNRAQFYLEFASGPFYSFNRPGAKVSQGVIQNWWRQAKMGSTKAHYDGVEAFSETDFTEDLKAITVPTLVMHGDDDQIVPIANSALLSVKLLKRGVLKVYEKFPHGMCTTHAEVINADLLSFFRSGEAGAQPSGRSRVSPASQPR
jgi:pimeloyl-ACP methyl ester carboxylesterase